MKPESTQKPSSLGKPLPTRLKFIINCFTIIYYSPSIPSHRFSLSRHPHSRRPKLWAAFGLNPIAGINHALKSVRAGWWTCPSGSAPDTTAALRFIVSWVGATREAIARVAFLYCPRRDSPKTRNRRKRASSNPPCRRNSRCAKGHRGIGQARQEQRLATAERRRRATRRETPRFISALGTGKAVRQQSAPISEPAANLALHPTPGTASLLAVLCAYGGIGRRATLRW